jgi:hypothetical protein
VAPAQKLQGKQQLLLADTSQQLQQSTDVHSNNINANNNSKQQQQLSMLGNNDLARYLPHSSPQSSTSPSVSLANMLRDSSGPFQDNNILTLSFDHDNFSRQNLAHSSSMVPVQLTGIPLSAPVLGSFSRMDSGAGTSTLSEQRPSSSLFGSNQSSSSASFPTFLQSPNSLFPPPPPPTTKKSTSRKKNRVETSSNPALLPTSFLPPSSLGKQPLELHGTSNLFITSSAGPTTTNSNQLYLNSTAAFLGGKHGPPSSINGGGGSGGGGDMFGSQQQQAALNRAANQQMLFFPTATTTMASRDPPKAKWQVSSASAFSPIEASSIFSSATEFITAAAQKAAIPGLAISSASSSAASPLSPPLQYTEMTNAVRRKKSSSNAAARESPPQTLEAASSELSPTTKQQLQSRIASRKSSEPVNLAQIQQTMATIKEEEEHDDKRQPGFVSSFLYWKFCIKTFF